LHNKAQNRTYLLVIIIMLLKESALIGIQTAHQISVPALITISLFQCRCGQVKAVPLQAWSGPEGPR